MTRPLTATQYDALTWLAKGGRTATWRQQTLTGLYTKGLAIRVRRPGSARRYNWFITADGVTALRETDRARKGADASLPPPAGSQETAMSNHESVVGMGGAIEVS